MGAGEYDDVLAAAAAEPLWLDGPNASLATHAGFDLRVLRFGTEEFVFCCPAVAFLPFFKPVRDGDWIAFVSDAKSCSTTLCAGRERAKAEAVESVRALWLHASGRRDHDAGGDGGR